MHRIYQRVADLTDINFCVEKMQIFIAQSGPYLSEDVRNVVWKMIQLTVIRLTLITSLVIILQILSRIKC
jgi:hypothetical protein